MIRIEKGESKMDLTELAKELGQACDKIRELRELLDRWSMAINDLEDQLDENMVKAVRCVVKRGQIYRVKIDSVSTRICRIENVDRRYVTVQCFNGEIWNGVPPQPWRQLDIMDIRLSKWILCAPGQAVLLEDVEIQKEVEK